MRAQKRHDTQPELALRRALHAQGLRFRIGLRVPSLPRRTIDIAFTKRRVAVFVDGCFWHGCPTHSVPAKHNTGWWREKILANKQRDHSTDEALLGAGWKVVRVWEHDDMTRVAGVVEQAVRPE